jgi:ureidoacrylate peracid hydrolase
VRDTWNTDIVAELAPKAKDIVIYKHRFSGFFETDLDATLRRLGIKHLVITGCTTSICVESTIRDAMFRDYSCIVLEDCTAEPIGQDMQRSNHEASLLTIQTLLGWTSSSEEFIRAIEPPHSNFAVGGQLN